MAGPKSNACLGALLLIATTIASHLAIVRVEAADPEVKGHFKVDVPPGWFESLQLKPANATKQPAEVSPACWASITSRNRSDYECGHAPLNTISRYFNDGQWRAATAKTDDYMPVRVVNGADELYGAWPSFVTIEMRAGFDVHTCGGTLITDRHVLTAAHCTIYGSDGNKYKPYNIRVTFADHNRHKVDKYEFAKHVKKIYRSPNYNLVVESGLVSPVHDWAILELENPVEFSPHIQPACLAVDVPPTRGSDSVCYLVGAGATANLEKQRRRALAEAGAGPSNSRLAALWPRSSNLSYKEIVQQLRVVQVDCGGWKVKQNDKSRVCYTGVTPGDSCSGDSGGPILCLDGLNRWTVTAIVSYGSRFCDERSNQPWTGVYTNVHNMLGEMMRECPNIRGYSLS